MGRFVGLVCGLAETGDDVHVWHLAGACEPACERRGRITLHRSNEWRWQGESREHRPDGETSLVGSPAPLASYLLREVLLPHMRETGGGAVMLAEDAATVGAMLHLDWVLRWAGLRNRVVMLWNASHPFGLERIDWRSISRAAYVTTTSPSVCYRLWALGVHPVLIPERLPANALQLVPGMTDQEIRDRFAAWH